MASSTVAVGVPVQVKTKTPTWRIRQSVVTYVSLIPYVAFALFPLYITLVTSVKTKQEINNPSLSPFWALGITTDNYKYLAQHTHFFDHWMINTFLVAVLATGISVVIGILAAYALARLRFRGENANRSEEHTSELQSQS